MYEQQNPQQQSQSSYSKRAIGGWTAASNGLQPGKNVEYLVEEITTGRGGAFRSVTFYKPYQSRKPEKAGQWERSFNLRIEDHAELIERVNHMLQNFSSIPGRYVFQPLAAAAQQVSQPQILVQPQPYQTPQQAYQQQGYQPLVQQQQAVNQYQQEQQQAPQQQQMPYQQAPRTNGNWS